NWQGSKWRKSSAARLIITQSKRSPERLRAAQGFLILSLIDRRISRSQARVGCQTRREWVVDALAPFVRASHPSLAGFRACALRRSAPAAAQEFLRPCGGRAAWRC